MKPQIQILIADDHFIVRLGLVGLINTEPDMAVVAEAADGAQAIEMFRKHDPDLAVLDMRMPVKNGIETTRELRKNNPEARILILTAFDGDEEIHKALEAGAQGYVLKNSTGEKLIPAVRAVAAGQRWVPKEIAGRLTARNLFEELTPRELQVLQQLARGMSNKEIADYFKITEYTAKDHLKNILAKLRVADRTEAVTAALQRGIIQL
jgi:DNA-binding NarL/FixJ family response regulator